MTRKQPSILDADKSLTEMDIQDCFIKFLNAIKEFRKESWIKVKDEKSDYRRITINYISKSDSGEIIRPSISIENHESCAGFEKYRTIYLQVSNCGLCRGTKGIQFDNKVIHKFDSSLEIAINLFTEWAGKASVQDGIQIEWQKVVDKCKIAVGTNKKKSKPDKTYEETYCYNIRGELLDSDYSKTFHLNLKDLTADQVVAIGRVLKTL